MEQINHPTAVDSSDPPPSAQPNNSMTAGTTPEGPTSRVAAITTDNDHPPLEPQQRLTDSPANLLRNWNPELMESSPPVAPAIVMDERATSGGQAYPVATAVGDWVRRSMQGNRATPTNETLPLSVRSEADLPTDTLRRPMLMQQHFSAPSMESNGTPAAGLDDNTEYILVGGEMIEAPVAPPNHHHQRVLEDSVRAQLRQEHCQPREMKTRIGRLSKLFKRGRRNKQVESTTTSADSNTSIRQASSMESNSLEFQLDPGLPSGLTPPSESADETDVNKKQVKGKKKFFGRRKKHAPKSPPRPQQQQPQQQVESERSFEPSFFESTSNDGSFRPYVYPPQGPPLPPLGHHVRFQTPLEQPAPAGMPHRNEMPLAPPTPPQHDFLQTSRTTSVTASYLGTADDPNSGMPVDSVAAESFVYEDMGGVPQFKKDDCEENEEDLYLPMSLVSDQADLKVEKEETPEIEELLHRAMVETRTDLDGPPDSDCLPGYLPIPLEFGGPMKSDGSPVPLSQATIYDETVYNDVLKVMVVAAPAVDKTAFARRLRNATPKKRRIPKTFRVDVNNWWPELPPESASLVSEPRRSKVNCAIWDVRGYTSDERQTNFGAHPGTQSIFFSPRSLYLLVWDLAEHNLYAQRYNRSVKSAYDSDFDDDDDEDDFMDIDVEEANREADRALGADIQARVLSWFDCIAQHGPQSAILPVVLIPEDMSAIEVDRRRNMLQLLLKEHYERKYDIQNDVNAPKLLVAGKEDTILSVENFGDFGGIRQLQEWIMVVANDPSRPVFDQVGSPVPLGTVCIRDAILRLKEDHMFIMIDHLVGAIAEDTLPLEAIISCLHFLSSIGEILYFGGPDDDELSRFVILSRKWLTSAISCILRNELDQEIKQTRKFMNMQCLYDYQTFEEHEVIHALLGNSTSNCPLLSTSDAQALWLSHNFMREATAQYADLVETSTLVPTMFIFLEKLLEQRGVFLPLNVASNVSSAPRSEVFFVPSLLNQVDPHNLWTYMSSQVHLTTLCHSWLFRDGAPAGLFETITVNVLRAIYDFTKGFASSTPCPSKVSRMHSFPLGSSFGEFIDQHDEQALGHVRIHHIVCFKTMMSVQLGTVFADAETGEVKESFVEVFIALVDQNSPYAVASDVMKPTMQRVVVRYVADLWMFPLIRFLVERGNLDTEGGYEMLFHAVRETLADMSNMELQVVCPECLLHAKPRSASTWSWDSVKAAAKSGSPTVICIRGHRVESTLLCGLCTERKPAPNPLGGEVMNVNEVLPSVVLVCVWDHSTKQIVSCGSGFISDKKLGLVVTAGHVIFSINGGDAGFGRPYFGYKNAQALIGVIPEEGGSHAVFRYYADLVAADARNVDACVLQIRSRLSKDTHSMEGQALSTGAPHALPVSELLAEELKSLKMTKHFALEESVRVIGYNQGGEGILQRGKHVCMSADFINGYICKHFKPSLHDQHSFSSDSSSSQIRTFAPKEEIVVICPTISGHSGGPCVNSEKRVIGILSRADPADPTRCYLVPATEIKPLLVQARNVCGLPHRSRLQSHQTI